MKKILPPLLLIGLCVQATAQTPPTDNPVLAAFPASEAFVINEMEYGNYSWTEAIAWDNVYDVTTDLTGAPFSGLSNVIKDDLPPNHPYATAADMTGHASDDTQIVNDAIAQLSADGGGVLYFPSGVYIFADDIVLADGVVLRGANVPATNGSGYGGGETADARDSDYDPLTDFYFPRLAGIVDDPDVPENGQRLDPALATDFSLMSDADKVHSTKRVKFSWADEAAALAISNYGIVNVDLNRGAIDFVYRERPGGFDRFSALFGSDFKNKTSGGNVVVFGNRMNNIIELEWTVPASSMNGWQIWSNRVAAPIEVMAKENAITANNRIEDNHYQVLKNGASKSLYPIDSFGMPVNGPSLTSTDVYLDKNGNQINEGSLGSDGNEYVMFRATNGNGIAMNRSGRTGYNASDSNEGTPAGEPSLYRDGIVVRQNWVFNGNRSAYHTSGFGLEVRDNVKRDRTGEVVYLNPQGDALQNNNSATYENRGIDVTGLSILVDGNDLEVQRRSIKGGYISVDGEGILVQANDGSPVWDWTITNNTVNAYIGIYRMGSIRNLNISNNTVTARNPGSSDKGYIMVDNSMEGGMVETIGNVTIDGNTVASSISIRTHTLDTSSSFVITNNDSSSITLPEFSNSFLTPPTLLSDTVFTISGNTAPVQFRDRDSGVPGAGSNPQRVIGDASGFTTEDYGDFPLSNLISAPPVIEIISPTEDQELTPGVPITVEVQITVSEAPTALALSEVALWDCSTLVRNVEIGGFEHRGLSNGKYGQLYESNEQSKTVLTSVDAQAKGSGLYTATWTPTQAYLDHGLFVVEAIMEPQTVQRAGSTTTSSYQQWNMALLNDTPATVPVELGVPTIVIGGSGDIDLSLMNTDPAMTYTLERTSSLDLSFDPVSGQSFSGNGGTLNFTAPKIGNEGFFRVVVSE